MIRVNILDDRVFASIDPNHAEKYLLANQWTEQRRLQNDLAIWYKRDSAGDIHRIWLPLDFKLADFTIAMKRVVETIAQTERCSQLQIFEDLNTIAIGDIIRLNTYDTLNRHATTLALDSGLILIEQGKGLAAASAMSEIVSREVHPSRRTAVVTNYLERLRLGQTEHGSYTIKLISPISEVQEDKVPTLPGTPTKIPFERRAVMKLVQGLESLHDVSAHLYKRGSFYIQPFLDVVSQGVSANLCEAITNTQDEAYHPLEVSVTWSYILDAPQTTKTNTISFPTEYMDYIAAAAKKFRTRHPESRSISGYVKVLSRERGESSGVISLIANIDNHQRVVRMELSGAIYLEALHAHEEDIFIKVSGNLVQKGKLLWLQNPKDLQLIKNERFPMLP